MSRKPEYATYIGSVDVKYQQGTVDYIDGVSWWFNPGAFTSLSIRVSFMDLSFH